MPALTTVVFIHIGLLWIALQSSPALPVMRQVVYQMLTPITRMAEQVPAPIAAQVVQRSARSVLGPIASAALTVPPAPITPMKPLERPIENEPVPVVETPEPQPRHVPVVKESVPIVMPEPPLVQLPPPMQELAQIPAQLPEPAPAPAPAPARALAITAVEKLPSGGTSVGAAPVVVGGDSASRVGAGSGLIYPNYMEKSPRQKSFSEMANEQLNPGGRRGKFAESVDAAEMPDCLAANQPGGLLAAPLIAYKAATGKCK